VVKVIAELLLYLEAFLQLAVAVLVNTAHLPEWRILVLQVVLVAVVVAVKAHYSPAVKAHLVKEMLAVGEITMQALVVVAVAVAVLVLLV
jgi:hypothetical protein